MTREQYRKGEVSHHEYYLSLAECAGIGNFSEKFLSRIKQCLESGDKHLNNIPLIEWDNMSYYDLKNPYLNTELKKRGDSWSLSVAVCMRKAKATQEAIDKFDLKISID